jgi:flagellar biosynthesis/type III secretory pathway protein FliH
VLEPIRLHAAPKRIALAAPRNEATFSEEEVEAARRDGYRRGSEEATRLLERQMIEQRSEMVALQSETFTAIARQRDHLVQQMREVVPELVIEAVARVLADTEFDREKVIRIANDLLNEIAPGREEIELQLSPHDLELIAGYEDGFREKHPAITFRANSDLRSGDCKILGRFGFVDGTLATKIRALDGFLK